MKPTEQEKPKRPPGRPPGHPKTGGRRKGVPNRTRAQTLERISQEADPIGFLIHIARGLQFEAAVEPGAATKQKMYPTHDQRLDAVRVLARKVVPDSKAVEMTGYPPLRETNLSAQARLTQYAVVDLAAGRYRIPVDRAMDLMVSEAGAATTAYTEDLRLRR